MSLQNRINRLISKASSIKRIDAAFEAKVAALETELRNMTDAELRAIVEEDASNKFSGLSDRELWEIIVGN